MLCNVAVIAENADASHAAQAVTLTPQDHAHYCDIPFASVASVHEEIVENLTLQTATAAGVSFTRFEEEDFDRFRRGGKTLEDDLPAKGKAIRKSRAGRNCAIM